MKLSRGCWAKRTERKPRWGAGGRGGARVQQVRVSALPACVQLPSVTWRSKRTAKSLCGSQQESAGCYSSQDAQNTPIGTDCGSDGLPMSRVQHHKHARPIRAWAASKNRLSGNKRGGVKRTRTCGEEVRGGRGRGQRRNFLSARAFTDACQQHTEDKDAHEGLGHGLDGHT